MNPKRADPSAELESGLAALGLAGSLAAPLLAYLEQLLKWNAAYNLTAVREPRAMVTRHLLDSLAVLPFVRTPLLDVGSGAGLPAIPLALANPQLAVTALDSNGKKVRFMRHVRRALNLENLTVVESRVEDFRPDLPYACVTSRAFAALGDFVAATTHLLAPGGQWLAMKGKLDDAEVGGLPPGVQLVEARRLRIPGLDEARHLIIVAKSNSEKPNPAA